MNKGKRKKFNISIMKNCALELELFSKDYIITELNSLMEKKSIKTLPAMPIHYRSLTVDGNTQNELNEIYKNKGQCFFAYIKFFEWENPNTHQTTLYGLVGGKTNHRNPDFTFDKNDSNTVKTKIARFFLNYYKLEWSKDIIIVHHETDFSERQAFFLETFLQRRFHLFDS